MPEKLSGFVRSAVAALSGEYPDGEAHSVVRVLCEDLLGIPGHAHVTHPDRVLSAAEEALLRSALVRLAGGEPVQYVTGKAFFCGHLFHVTPDVLIPRPETEGMVREAVNFAQTLQGTHGGGLRVLDLCTGSGNVAWSVAAAVAGAQVVGVDISPRALAVAGAQALPLPPGCVPPAFCLADILAPPGEELLRGGAFDLILANPPYVPESERPAMRRNVLEHEPASAIFVPVADPFCFCRAVARWASRLLAPGGRGWMEISERFAGQVSEIFREAGFAGVQILEDFHGDPRFVTFVKK